MPNPKNPKANSFSNFYSLFYFTIFYIKHMKQFNSVKIEVPVISDADIFWAYFVNREHYHERNQQASKGYNMGDPEN